MLPPGEYTWQGVYHDPISAKHVLSVSNAGKPSYNTPDGKGAWGGDWGCPTDVCFAGDRGLLVWDGSEAGMGLIGVDANGNKQWGYRIGGSFVATDGEWVFTYLGMEKQIRAYGVADGKQINFRRGELWAEHNAMVDGEKKKPVAGKPAEPVPQVPGTLCTGLAWMAGKLYVANAAANEIAEYDAKQGKILRRLTVSGAGDLAVAGNGVLLVLANGAVHKFTVADGTLTPFISSHLEQPVALAVAPDGSVFVSNRGQLHNISLFSKDGAFVRGIGKPGSRQMENPLTTGNLSIARAGTWDPDTVLNPAGRGGGRQGPALGDGARLLPQTRQRLGSRHRQAAGREVRPGLCLHPDLHGSRRPDPRLLPERRMGSGS